MVADQHHPAMLPAVDGVCICVIRHQDLSVAQLLTNTVSMIADAADKEVKQKSPDEQGACSVIQMATKCHHSKFPVWPKQGRSEGDALTLDVLAQYSAANYVDLFPSLFLEEHTKDKTVTVTRIVPKVGPMIVRSASVQNLVMGIQEWSTVAHSRAEINEYTCFNMVRHRDPAKLSDQFAYRTHVVECYRHKKGIGGRVK
jgi:hypothetical protein